MNHSQIRVDENSTTAWYLSINLHLNQWSLLGGLYIRKWFYASIWINSCPCKTQTNVIKDGFKHEKIWLAMTFSSSSASYLCFLKNSFHSVTIVSIFYEQMMFILAIFSKTQKEGRSTTVVAAKFIMKEYSFLIQEINFPRTRDEPNPKAKNLV